MAKEAGATFTNWLNGKLRELNLDESVFGSYIVGILAGDESQDEKKEALNDILTEIIEENLEDLIAEILKKWLEIHPKDEEPIKKGLAGIDVNEQLAKLLEAQKLQATVKAREYTEEERRIKEQILAQYSESAVSDAEDDESAEDDDQAANSGGLERNTNAHDVMQLHKERRDQARLDSAAKKQKDKDDREKQKQMREEKKEKRKTVKGERRR